MDIVDSIRCLFELIIFPVVSWLGGIFARNRKNATASSDEPRRTLTAPASRIPTPRLPLDPKIEQLQEAGDIFGLLTVLHTDKDPVLRLDAADALAQMGNDEGVDYLIERLQSPDLEEQEAVREALQELNDARGNAALEGHRAGGGPPVVPGLSAGETAAGDPWAAYFDRQASMEGQRLGSFEQPVAVGAVQETTATTPTAGTKPPRWVKDFGPGALGAVVVTLAFLAVGYFVELGLTPEDRLSGLYVQLICFPVTLVLGALSGALASLVVQAIARAAHFGERVQKVTSTTLALVSGAVVGAFCDGFFLLAAYI